MKLLSPLVFSALIGATILSGCALSPMGEHSGSMGSMTKSDSDMTSMCEMHKKMMRSMSPEEQKAMMDKQMKDMSAEMRAQHMEKRATASEPWTFPSWIKGNVLSRCILISN